MYFRRFNSAALGLAVACLCATSIAQGAIITTTFSSDNSRRGNMFNVDVNQNVTISAFDVNLASGLTKDIFVYYKSGSYVGFEGNAGAWTLAGSQSVTSAGGNSPTFVDIPDFVLNAGSYALFVTTDGQTSGSFQYTNGATTYSDAVFTIYSGVGTAVPFDGDVIGGRIWNGSIYYTAGTSEVPEPSSLALVLGPLALFGVRAFRRRQAAR